MAQPVKLPRAGDRICNCVLALTTTGAGETEAQIAGEARLVVDCKLRPVASRKCRNVGSRQRLMRRLGCRPSALASLNRISGFRRHVSTCCNPGSLANSFQSLRCLPPLQLL